MNRSTNKREKRFIITMMAILAIIIAIALYGYFTGAWDTNPT